MSDGEMIDEDISPPPQQSQGFNIADVLSTGSCSSIGQDSLDVGDTSPHLEINRKSDFSVDEASALENLKRLYPFVDQNVSFNIDFGYLLISANSFATLLESD